MANKIYVGQEGAQELYRRVKALIPAVDQELDENSSNPISNSAVTEAVDGKADVSTTLAGYGITDAYTKTETDTLLGGKVDKVSGATSGNIVVFGASGVITDSNKSIADLIIGSSDEFIDFPISSNTVNIGGRDYTFVQIGDYYWTTENLDWQAPGIHIYDGKDRIFPYAKFPEYSLIEQQNSAWYYVDEASNGVNGNRYGLLYTGYAAHNLTFPTGWSIPDEAAITNLISTVGSTNASKLKSTKDWNTVGTDDYGFNAIPSGYYDLGDSGASCCGYLENQQVFSMHADNNAGNKFNVEIPLLVGTSGSFGYSLGYSSTKTIDGVTYTSQGYAIRLCKHI